VPKSSASIEGQHVVSRSEQLRQVLDVFVAAGALLGIVVDAAVVVYYALLGVPGSSIDKCAAESAHILLSSILCSINMQSFLVIMCFCLFFCLTFLRVRMATKSIIAEMLSCWALWVHHITAHNSGVLSVCRLTQSNPKQCV